MITQIIPIENINEFGELYLKIYKTFPDYIKILCSSPFITTSDKEIKIYTLIEIPDKMTGNGLKEITKYFNKFDAISSHIWKIETLIKRNEALKMIGLSLDG
ncbi:MAG: hypothetical protein ACTSYZ_12995 [Candidatus Helarchaeota archaeon]